VIPKHAMKPYVAVEVYVQALVTSAQDGVEWSA